MADFAPITCRQCGASTAHQDEFQIVETVIYDGVQEVAYHDDGSWTVEGVETATRRVLETAEVHCPCGHWWDTTRRFPR